MATDRQHAGPELTHLPLGLRLQHNIRVITTDVINCLTDWARRKQAIATVGREGGSHAALRRPRPHGHADPTCTTQPSFQDHMAMLTPHGPRIPSSRTTSFAGNMQRLKSDISADTYTLRTLATGPVRYS